MTSPFLLILLLPFIVPNTSLLSSPMDYLEQQEICSYQPHMEMVMCRCLVEEASSRLHIQWNLFKPEPSVILVESCPCLDLSLDMAAVTLHNHTLHVKDSAKVVIVSIEPDDHQLNIELEDVDKFVMEKQIIEAALTISTVNVKSVLLYQASLAHLPPPGLSVVNADKVSIIDSVLNNTAPGVVSLDTVEEVEIVNNQFNIDTIQLVQTKNSTNLYISCNRLLGEPVSLECATISSSLNTVSSRSSLSSTSLSSMISPGPTLVSEKQGSIPDNSILWLLVCVGLAVLTTITICICCRGRQGDKGGLDEEKHALNTNIETEKQEVQNVDKEESTEKMLDDEIGKV